MRQVVLGLGIALLAGALASACGGSSCVEGMSVACACPGGGSGAQLCHGGQYGECVCGVSGDDGGLGGDGGVPASDGSMPGRDGSTPGPDGSTADGGTSDGGAPGCTGGATRCGASGVERCESGAWVADTSCAIGCMDGACADAPAMCTPGATRCFRTSVQRCNRDGTAWLFDSVCADGCADGLCTGACTAGADRCNGDQRETCASDGASWSASETCDMGCESSVCVEAELTLNGTVMDLSGTHVYAGCVDVDPRRRAARAGRRDARDPRPMPAGQRQREHHHRRRRHAALPRERERRRRGHGDGWRRSVPRVARHAAALGQRELDAHRCCGPTHSAIESGGSTAGTTLDAALYGSAFRTRARTTESCRSCRRRPSSRPPTRAAATGTSRKTTSVDHLGSAVRLGPRLLRQRRRHHAEPGRRHLPLDRVIVLPASSSAPATTSCASSRSTPTRRSAPTTRARHPASTCARRRSRRASHPDATAGAEPAPCTSRGPIRRRAGVMFTGYLHACDHRPTPCPTRRAAPSTTGTCSALGPARPGFGTSTSSTSIASGGSRQRWLTTRCASAPIPDAATSPEPSREPPTAYPSPGRPVLLTAACAASQNGSDRRLHVPRQVLAAPSRIG